MLTDIKIRATKATEKMQKLYDGRGLFLQVTPTGSKRWRYKYRFKNKEKLLALGLYPDVTLTAAREKCEEARKRLKEGIDPGQHRKDVKTNSAEHRTNNFEFIAREWFAKYSPEWVPSHQAKLLSRLERNVFPWLGDKSMSEITPPMLLKVLRQIEARGVRETVHRVLSSCSKIFRYAISSGYVAQDPTRDLRDALLPMKSKHFAAQTEPQKFGVLLRMIDTYVGTPIIRCALRLAPLVFVRPGELRRAKWVDIDFEKAQWRFTVSKTNTPHIVPLSTQAVALLQEIQPLTGSGPYVFPSSRSAERPMSENAVLGALRSLGISKEEATGHGFRASARTLLHEVLKVRPDCIEHQLAHAVRDPNGRAYNRTTFLDERTKMMQDWADYLDKIKQDK